MRVFARVLAYALAVGLAYGSMAERGSIQAWAGGSQIADAAGKAGALNARELVAIYADHTWSWDGGGEYFAENQTYTASTGKGEKASYAKGTWTVGDDGQLCYNATWYALEGHLASKTCFEHRKDAEEIYQRMLPNGEWYIFSHLPAQSGDPIQKLQRGDQISDAYRENQRYLAEHKDQINKDAAKARPLTTKELTAIYADHTWDWGSGAAYFQSNRAYLAWSGKGKSAAYGKGSWSANDRGHLCSTAMWHSIRGRGMATTCFELRTDGKDIYQRKLPKGAWFVFSRTPVEAGDAINKLSPGDHVSEAYRATARSLGRRG